MIPIRRVCVDIDGTLTNGIGGTPLPGAVEALATLSQVVPIRLVTNTTSRNHAWLCRWLARIGFDFQPSDLTTPAMVAGQVLTERGHARGILLADEEARPDLSWFKEAKNGPAVLIATEGHHLSLADLQPAFRALLGGAHLYTLQQNRYFKRKTKLVTDLGPLAAFLSYASGCAAENLGKPSALLFDAVAGSAGVDREAMLMIGDDAEFDASGAVALGMRGILVRTGKYREGDESRFTPAPTAVLDSVVELPEWEGLRHMARGAQASAGHDPTDLEGLDLDLMEVDGDGKSEHK